MLATEIKTVVQLYSEAYFEAIESWAHHERPDIVKNRIILLETTARLLQKHGQEDEAYQFCLVDQITKEPISSDVMLFEVG
jgi:two-component SAPR family response regulator